MKAVITILLFFVFYQNATATTNIYVSSSSGNDTTGTGSIGAPYRSIAKVNSIFSSLSPGDSVLLRRGDVFPGSFNISRSGTLGHSIIIAGYSSGANPVITGFKPVAGWILIAPNKWQSAAITGGPTYVNVLVKNDFPLAMGRYPNKGYLTIDSHGSNYFYDAANPQSTINWTGAEAVIRPRHWILDRDRITSHSNTKFTVTTSSTYSFQDGWGYFIQNSPLTLDTTNEWYYNPSILKVTMYSATAPTNIQVATVDTLVKASSRSYITFSGIDFDGANKITASISGGTQVYFLGCNIKNAGIYAVKYSGSYFQFQNGSIRNSLNNHILSQGDHGTIKNNVFRLAGWLPGMGQSADGQYFGIKLTTSSSDKTTIEGNIFDSTGYCPVDMSGADSVEIRNNLITTGLFVKDDGGLIYTFLGATATQHGRKIIGNIGVGAIGAPQGTDGNPGAEGIYFDDRSNGVDSCYGNVIGNIQHRGVYIHNSHELNIKNNIFFNSGQAAAFKHDDHDNDTLSNGSLSFTNRIKNVTFQNNLLFNKLSNQLILYVTTYPSGVNDYKSYGLFRNNRYCRPISEPQGINNSSSSTGAIADLVVSGSNKYYSLDYLKSGYAQMDSGTLKTPKGNDSIRFEYNASYSDTSIFLNHYSWIDPKTGVRYGTTTPYMTLSKWSGIVLIRDTAVVFKSGGNPLPVIFMTSPAAGGVSSAPAILNLAATATITSGTITRVNFYNGLTYLGTSSTSPYSFSYTPVPSGGYSLNAHAISSYGDSVISASVPYTVKGTNTPPQVSITSPADSSVFVVGTDITFTAVASDVDGDLYRVSLLVDGVSIARVLTADQPFTTTWTPTIGTYTLTASAKDSASDTTLSAPIHVTIRSALPFSASVSVTPIACNGGNGIIVVSATGGTPPYTNTGTFTRAVGPWTFPISDGAGAKDTARVTLTQPTALSATAALDSIISTYGGTTSLTVTATGGTPGYLYSIDGGVTYYATNVFIVPAGVYTLTVKDFNGCLATTSITVTQPTPPTNLWIHQGKGHQVVN